MAAVSHTHCRYLLLLCVLLHPGVELLQRVGRASILANAATTTLPLSAEKIAKGIDVWNQFIKPTAHQANFSAASPPVLSAAHDQQRVLLQQSGTCHCAQSADSATTLSCLSASQRTHFHSLPLLRQVCQFFKTCWTPPMTSEERSVCHWSK